MHGKLQVPSALVIINPDLPATHPVRGIMLLIQPYFCSCGKWINNEQRPGKNPTGRVG